MSISNYRHSMGPAKRTRGKISREEDKRKKLEPNSIKICKPYYGLIFFYKVGGFPAGE